MNTKSILTVCRTCSMRPTLLLASGRTNTSPIDCPYYYISHRLHRQVAFRRRTGSSKNIVKRETASAMAPPSMINCETRREFSVAGSSKSRNGVLANNITSNQKSLEIPSRDSNNDNVDDDNDYTKAIQILNSLQSNTQVLALAKYRQPENILPLFREQLQLAGVRLEDIDKLNVIHVSGTKGKGSTCAFTESILRAAGLKTGFYNSPHLIKVTERIKINGEPIDDILFSKYFHQVYRRLSEQAKCRGVAMPSYFSFLTILAFHIFIEEKVDCAVVEVGIGGEYDPTNVIQSPVACAITTLDFDHTNILGNTIESIARNKAGIIKSRVPVFTIEHEQPEAFEAIKARAHDRGAPLIICKLDSSSRFNQIELGIKGPVQYRNATIACQLANHLLSIVQPDKFSSLVNCSQGAPIFETGQESLPRVFRTGLAKCSWPGRCQIIKYSSLAFYLDGAHTRKSMQNCLDWFLESSQRADKNAFRILMVNIIGERDKCEVLRPLTKLNIFDHVFFSSNRINSAGDTPKSETFVNIQGQFNEKSMDNVKSNAQIWKSLMRENNDAEVSNIVLSSNVSDGIKAIVELTRSGSSEKTNTHVLATGSLHFVGAVLETLQNNGRLLE